jgi:alpha-galactosidase
MIKALMMKKQLIYIFLLLFGVVACSPRGMNEGEQFETVVLEENIGLNLNQLQLVGDIQPFNQEIRIDTLGENIYLINLSLYTDFPSSLPKFEMYVKYPQKLVHSLWNSRTWSNNSFINIPNYSRLQSDLTVVSALTSTSQNRITLATYDDFKGRFTQVDIKQLPDSLVFSINFFNDAAPDAEILEFKVKVLVDLSSQQFSQSIRNTAQWLLDQDTKRVITKIDLSMQPVYSLWYPLDRNIPLENITHYFDSIQSMGFRSVLFDDGWQNVVRFEVDKNGRWDPSQITIVKDFMDKAKAADMKVALWYSLPITGANQYVFDHFDGKYLQYRTSSQPILDIRYPEVRKYLTDMYSEIVTEWGVDGIWFNFLNGYYPNEHIIVTDDLGRDFVSVRKSLDSLRANIEQKLLEVQPELSINQSYPTVGPLHSSNTKSISGFLGTTVLGQVREKLVNNRLMYGEYSPLMEVMGIHPKDPPVDIARKFQTIMFGVPYISYFSYTLPDEVRETLAYWVKYWKANTEYLVESDFYAFNPVQRYPLLKSGNQVKQIFAVYDRIEPVNMDNFDFEEADLINSSDYGYVSVFGVPEGKVDYIVYDHKGIYVERGSLKFKRDIATLAIPSGGFARLLVK